MNLKKIIALSALTVLASCGFTGDDPVDNKDVYVSNTIGDCKINTVAFNDIMEKEIPDDIRCVQENFYDYVMNVEAANENNDKEYIEHDQILKFIQLHLENDSPENKQTIKDAIDLIFTIAEVVFLDEDDHLSTKNFDRLTDVIILFNRMAAIIDQNIKMIDDNTSLEEVNDRAATIRQGVKDFTDVAIYEMGQAAKLKGEDVVHSHELSEVLENINRFYDDRRLTGSEKFIYFKTLAVGGEANIVKTHEFKRVLEILPDAAEIAIKAVFTRPDHFADGEQGLYREYNKLISRAIPLINDRAASDLLIDKFGINEILSYFEKSISKDQREKIVNTIFVIKNNLLGGDANKLVAKDLSKLSFYAQTALEGFGTYKAIGKLISHGAIEDADQDEKFLSILNASSYELKKIYSNERNEIIGAVDVSKLLNELEVSLGTNLETVKSFLPLKRTILGGEPNIITDTDYLFALNHFTTVGTVVFDALYATDSIIDDAYALFDDRDEDAILLSKDELTDLVLSFTDYENVDALINTIFKVKEVLLKTDSENIVVKDLTKLRPLLKAGMQIYDAFAAHDKKFNLDTVRALQGVLIPFLEGDELNDFAINAQDVIESLDSSLVDDDLKNAIVKMLPLKALITGDNSLIVDKSQLQTIVKKADALYSIYFKASSFKTANFGDDYGHMARYALNVLKDINAAIYKFDEPKTVELISLDDLAAAFNATKFKDSISTLINKFLKGEDGKVTMFVVNEALGLVKEIAEGALYNDLAFRLNAKVLASPDRVRGSELQKLDNDLIKELNAERLDRAHDEFVELVETLAFYRTPEGKQYYTNDIRRTRYGLIESGMAKVAVERLLGAYCVGDDTNPKTCGVDDKVLFQFLTDIKSLLVEFNFWSPTINTFAQNVLYLADLFQMPSNGSQKIERLEGVEYVSLVLSAVNMAGEVTEKLLDRCGNYTGDPDNIGIELECFRSNILDIWTNELGYGKYFSAFDRFIKDHDDQTLREYIVYIEKFVHENLEDPFMCSRDINLFVGAIQNIEAMIIRFDVNRNNILDPSEVEDAFQVYRNIIVNMGDLKGWKEKFALPAFKVMILYMHFPTPEEVMKWQFNPFTSRDVSAERINVASILCYFALLGK